MRVLSVVSHSEEQTVALANRLANSLGPGDVVVLTGSLGSGKTTFVRALAAARGIDPERVTSPSFALVHEYGGNPPLYHIDLYRLSDVSELTEVGWDDYLGRDGIVVVEWGEKAGDRLPSRYYLVQFAIVGDSARRIDFSLVQT